MLQAFSLIQLLLLLLLIPGITLYGQDPTALKNTVISFPDTAFTQSNSLLPFQNISILDARFDTVRLGVLINKKDYRNIIPETGDLKNLEIYLKNNYINSQPDSKTSLLLVIKKLWLQDVSLGELEDNLKELEDIQVSECIARLELYSYEEKQYQALIRLDTVLVKRKSPEYNEAKLLMEPFSILFDQLKMADLAHLFRFRKKISHDELINYYFTRKQAPRLLYDSLERGVFLSFNDFMNRRPSYIDFEFEKDKKGNYLYVIEKGVRKLLTEYWGFCNGYFHFVKINQNVFRLYRYNNSYTFWGYQQPIRKERDFPLELKVLTYMILRILPASSYDVRLIKKPRPMQLDLDTGEAY